MPSCKEYLCYYHNRGNRGTERCSIFSHVVQPEWGAERQAVEPGSRPRAVVGRIKCAYNNACFTESHNKCQLPLQVLCPPTPTLLEACLVPDGCCVYVKRPLLSSSHTALSSAPLGTQPCSTTDSIHSILALFSGQLSARLFPRMAGTSGLCWLRSPQRTGNAAV